MNNYPKWWDATITLYNKYINPDTKEISWYRHILENCFWKDTNNREIIQDMVLETNYIICRIPKNDLYLPRYEWVNLEDKSQNFTFGVGDILVDGSIEEDIDEYSKDMRSSDFLKRHKDIYGCMTIQRFQDDTGSIRNNPHYYIRGI